MAEDKEETAGLPAPKGAAGEPPANPPAKPETNNDLPTIESPPLSPAGETSQTAPEPAIEPTDLVVFAPEATRSGRANFRFKARHKRTALLAASVALAAALGVIIGATAVGPFAVPTPQLAANLPDRTAMQRSIGQLRKEIAALKARVAAADTAARNTTPKTAERVTSAPEITGSIPLPKAPVPTPAPRPAIATEIRPAVVQDWSIRFVRDGYVYVQGHGDTYQVQLGAPLPGLGPVGAVKRRDGRWYVVTPKGVIVSLRDRRYFEHF
jgi:hypothetical protein